ncbi:MAG TPA: hypothetical protein VGP96_00370 [Candidatus Dormibacteraeota bacterium]|jgi:hypothetical protein|nr:hypothetical protein [Candidatus Dormibacteraeota bacterium]
MLSDDDLVEAARIRRRRVFAALDGGSQAPTAPSQRPLVRVAAGLGVSALLALGTAVGGLVHASLHDQGGASSRPAATASPAPPAAGPRAGG